MKTFLKNYVKVIISIIFYLSGFTLWPGMILFVFLLNLAYSTGLENHLMFSFISALAFIMLILTSAFVNQALPPLNGLNRFYRFILLLIQTTPLAFILLYCCFLAMDFDSPYPIKLRIPLWIDNDFLYDIMPIDKAFSLKLILFVCIYFSLLIVAILVSDLVKKQK